MIQPLTVVPYILWTHRGIASAVKQPRTFHQELQLQSECNSSGSCWPFGYVPLRTLNRQLAVVEVVIPEVHLVMETLTLMGLHLRLQGHRRAVPVSLCSTSSGHSINGWHSVVVNNVNLDNVIHYKPKSLSFQGCERRLHSQPEFGCCRLLCCVRCSRDDVN